MSFDASTDASTTASPEAFVARPSQCQYKRILSVELDGWTAPSPPTSEECRCVESLRMLADAGFVQPGLLVRHALNALLNDASARGETGCNWRLFVANGDVDALWTAVVTMILAGETSAGRATVTTASVASPGEIHLIDIRFSDFNDARIHPFLEKLLSTDPAPACQLRLAIDAVTAVKMALPAEVGWILERAKYMKEHELTQMPNDLYTLVPAPPADPTDKPTEPEGAADPAAPAETADQSVTLNGSDIAGLRRISDLLGAAIGSSASCRVNFEKL